MDGANWEEERGLHSEVEKGIVQLTVGPEDPGLDSAVIERKCTRAAAKCKDIQPFIKGWELREPGREDLV